MKEDKKCWVMLPYDPVLEEEPLHQFFFLVGFCFFLFLNKRKKLLASAPVSFHCNTAHSCKFTCVNLGCHKPGSTEVVILI